jgi:hypothetical protein
MAIPSGCLRAKPPTKNLLFIAGIRRYHAISTEFRREASLKRRRETGNNHRRRRNGTLVLSYEF